MIVFILAAVLLTDLLVIISSTATCIKESGALARAVGWCPPSFWGARVAALDRRRLCQAVQHPRELLHLKRRRPDFESSQLRRELLDVVFVEGVKVGECLRAV